MSLPKPTFIGQEFTLAGKLYQAISVTPPAWKAITTGNKEVRLRFAEKSAAHMTLAEAQADGTLFAGQKIRLTDFYDAPYKVVTISDTGGIYKPLNAVLKLRLNTSGKKIFVPYIGTDKDSVQLALDKFKHLEFGDDISYGIAGTCTVRSNTKLEFGNANISQLNDQAALFDVTNTIGVRATDGNFFGKVEASFLNSSSSLARAFTGTGAINIKLLRGDYKGFYYSPVFLENVYNVTYLKNTVVGIKSVLETNTDYRNCTGGTFIGAHIRAAYNDIAETAQGLIIGQGSRNVTLANNNIHDLVNEHGIYCDTGIINLNIIGNIITNTGVFGVGIKVQVYDAFGVQSKNIIIKGNVTEATGSDGFLLDNTSPTPTLKILGVTIQGNTSIDAGGYAFNIRDAQDVEGSGNIAINPALSGLFWSGCTGLSWKSNTIRGSKRSAMSDGIDPSHNVTFKDITITNCATDDIPGDNFGLLVQLAGSNYVVDSFNVTDSLGNMEHAMYFAANINSTLSLIDNVCPDSVSSAVRFGSTDPLRVYKGNVFKSAFNATVLPSIDTATAVAAGLLTLPIGPEVLTVNGSNGFYYIEPAGHTGIRITLIFKGTLTVNNTSNILLDTPFNATPNSTLTLVCDGVSWYRA